MSYHTVIGDAYTLSDGTVLPLSRAVRAGDYVYLAGQLGLNEDGILSGETMAEQTRQAIENIEIVLKQAGCSLSNVIKANVWVTDKEDFPEFNRTYGECFVDNPPVRSTVCSALMLEDALVEIEVIAYSPITTSKLEK